MRRDRAAEFGYTKAEACFCDRFDAFAAQWEQEEWKMVEDALCRACDVCLERKPLWMSSVRLVHDGEELDKGLQDGCEEWQSYVRRLATIKRRSDGQPLPDGQVDDGTGYCGSYLCDRCRAPTAIEKSLGLHKFSIENNALLRRLPVRFAVAELDAQLAADPFAVFAVATDAELALVRMTIPW